MFLNRSIPGKIETSEFYDINTADSGETLGTDNLDFNYELGTRVTLGYSPNAKEKLSVSFFGLQEFNSSATLRAPVPGFPNPIIVQVLFDESPLFPPVDSFGDRLNLLNQPPPLGQGNGSFQITRAFVSAYEHRVDYSSNLYNFELNYER